jgi:site-specific DNA recombinase
MDVSRQVAPLRPERAVAYVRVSQAREGMISPELQMAAVSEYSARRGYRIVAVLEDLDLSGRFWRERQVDEAVSMLEQGQAEVIVVWRWSRIARNRLDWAVAVNRVESAGGRLESATEQFDVRTSTGRFARGMLAEFAAYESDRMGDVWREVRERRARLGLPVNGHNQFGYLKQGDAFVADRRTGPVIADLYRRYVAGESLRSLARWLNRGRYMAANPRMPRTVWSHGTVAALLDRGFAAGYIVAEGQYLPGAQKALITEAEWLAYRSRREQNQLAASHRSRRVPARRPACLPLRYAHDARRSPRRRPEKVSVPIPRNALAVIHRQPESDRSADPGVVAQTRRGPAH